MNEIDDVDERAARPRTVEERTGLPLEETDLATPRSLGRPAFLRWLAGAGIGLVAATATRLARARPASAHPCPPDFVQAGCCCLSTNVWPACPDACPGEQSRQWTCCHGGQLVACFECTWGDTCYEGPHLCSSTFPVGSAC